MAARAGASFDDVAAAGRWAVRPGQLLPGVGDLIDEICLEVLLGDGTRLVVLRQPWQGRTGDADGPGAVRVQDGDIEMHEGLEHRQLLVRNASARAIRVASHFPFWRVNPRLEFDRDAARGSPARPAVRALGSLGPGEAKEVELIRVPGLETQ